MMSLDTRRTRNGARLCRQHDRRMHDKVGGARSARRLARGPALARRRRRRLRQSRAGNATRRARGAVMSLDTRRTRNGALVCRQHDRRMYDEVGGARIGTTTRSRPGARSASPVAALTEPSRRCDEESKRRGDVTRHTAHSKRRACVSTARSAHARRGRRRSIGTTTRSRPGARSASPVAALTEPSRQCDEKRKRRDDVTRHTAHSKRRACVSTARSAHARQGRRRSVGTTTRSRLGARSASPAAAQTEPSRQCDEEGKRRGDVTRHTAHAKRRACVSTARSAHARQGRRRSVGTTTRSRLGARSAGVAGVGSDRAELAMQRKRRGDVTRHTAHATRECVCVCRRRDRRTHDKVGGARSARRLARGSALARRASPVPALTEPSRRCNARGAVMSLDTRRTRHESACACVDGTIGARTTRSAALGRHDDSLAARRSLGGRRRCRL